MAEITPFPSIIHQAADKELSKMLDDVAEVYLRYVTFTDPRYAFACALWCAHTFLFRPTNMHGIITTGYLAFASPEHNCGKTDALLVTSHFSWGRPTLDVTPSSATIFRNIDDDKAEGGTRHTIILDELDGITEDTSLINLLNSGYKRGATVKRQVGADFSRQKMFKVFCPKAFGYIRDSKSLKAIKKSLESRCLRIHMKRRTAKEQKVANKLYEPILHKETDELAQALLRWEMNKCPDLQDLLLSKFLWMDELSGREQEVWDNLFALAHLAGRLDEAQEIARKVVAQNREEFKVHEPVDAQIFRDLRRKLHDLSDEDGFSIDLAIEHLRSLPDREYNKPPRELNQKRLGTILATYGCHSRPRGMKRRRRVDPEQVADMIDRYLEEKDDDDET